MPTPPAAVLLLRRIAESAGEFSCEDPREPASVRRFQRVVRELQALEADGLIELVLQKNAMLHDEAGYTVAIARLTARGRLTLQGGVGQPADGSSHAGDAHGA